MKNLMLFAFALLTLVTCGPVESPAPVTAPEPLVQADTASDVTSSAVAGVSISSTGTVTLPNLIATVCIYEQPMQARVWNSYRVGPWGTYPLRIPSAWCGQTTVQVDVQRGVTCPTNGTVMGWDGFLAGRLNIPVSKACPIACSEARPCPTGYRCVPTSATSATCQR